MIHTTAIVDPKAQLGHEVKIGPYCCVGPKVVLDDGVELISHVVIDGRTTVGKGTRIYPFAILGQGPQSIGYKGEDTALVIGENNTIREHATMHLGTVKDKGMTTVGNNNLFMVGTHVAHDCVVGNNVIMANNAALGGHVVVGDYVIFGGLCAIHQFVRIGHHAMISGMAGVEHDVIPYGFVVAPRSALSGLNIVGLRRNNFTRDAIQEIRTAYRLLFAEEGTLAERIKDVSDFYQNQPIIMDIIDFMTQDSKRDLCLPRR